MKRLYTLFAQTLSFALLLAAISAPLNVRAQELDIHGFTEGAFGTRVEDNDNFGDDDNTMNEVRLQLQLSHYGDRAQFFSSVDIFKDNELGAETATELREAYFQLELGSKADVKVGRQVLTWGVGDLVFINDIFPKDYVSFFIGREDPYLKRPSDAVKLRFFTKFADFDIVGIPYFEPDRLPTGDRLSSFNPLAGGITGATNLPSPTLPDANMGNSEIALRAYRYLGNFQGAVYLFRGYYKTPQGMDMGSGTLYYPELAVYGASVRGPMFGGVLASEYGYYDSREEDGGNDPLVPNSQHRYLVGFERQWWTDFTAGFQYYGEYMQDHGRYLDTLPAGSPEQEELRQLLTARLTQQMLYQTLQLSLFAFYSPSDEDWHLRPNVTYKFSDTVSVSGGANLFDGDRAHTMFGQFQDNNNLYARFRYAF